MTVAEMAKYIGAGATIALEGMAFDVKILDVRTVYGNLQACITPARGVSSDVSGTKWVSLDRLIVE